MSQLEFPLLQLASVASCSLTVHLLEDSVFCITSLVVVENGNQIPPQPSLLQAEQTQLPQLLLLCHVLLALLVASAGLVLIW